MVEKRNWYFVVWLLLSAVFYKLDLFLVYMDQTAVISAEACKRLSLLTVNVVNKVLTISPPFTPISKEQIISEGLGEFEVEYHIELTPL